MEFVQVLWEYVAGTSCRLGESGHGLPLRLGETLSVHFLDELLLLFWFPGHSGVAVLSLPLRCCTAGFPTRTPSWKPPTVEHMVTPGFRKHDGPVEIVGNGVGNAVVSEGAGGLWAGGCWLNARETARSNARRICAEGFFLTSCLTQGAW